jgi:hypothetical protein
VIVRSGRSTVRRKELAAHGPSSISREFLRKVENRHVRLT